MICIINIRKRIYCLNLISKMIINSIFDSYALLRFSPNDNKGNENLYLTLHYDSFRFVSPRILFNTFDGTSHQVVLK